MPFGSSSLNRPVPTGPSTTRSSDLLVGEHVGQIEHLELAHAQRAELRHRRREHLHRAQLQRFEFLAVLVELAVGIDLDLHPALGLGFGQFLEPERALALGRVVGDDVAELDDDRLGLLRLCARGQYQRHGRARQINQLHDISSGFMWTSRVAPTQRIRYGAVTPKLSHAG